jgi:prepilin-type N-terminal cleavage/methylation domain-containing protein
MDCARPSPQAGFTLVEVMMTMLVLLVGMAGAVTMVNGSNAITAKTKQREAATNLQRELIEAARSIPYAQLTQNGLASGLEARPGLADSTPSTTAWTIERRGTVYTVDASTCAVDDVRDDFGSHASGTFCSGQTEGTVDTAPDDFKRVVVDLEWSQHGRTSESRQATIITNPSNNSGPQITSLVRDPTDDPVTSALDVIEFTATTATVAAAVRFTVDGSVVETVTPTGASVSFDWEIDTEDGFYVDGTYVVAATALDAAGLAGATRSLTVKLNRFAPDPPTGVAGGWNATREGVEVEWSQNDEADVVGYRVYRGTGAGAPEVVCATDATVTECFDDSHGEPLAPSYDYHVVALDEVSETGAQREGQPSATFPVAPTENRPSPPATLTGQLLEGNHYLSWTLPAAADPSYAGDGIFFYRIYRDGTAVSDRFDFTGLGTELDYLDTKVAGGTREYWVTAVDHNYSESEPVGPVTLP